MITFPQMKCEMSDQVEIFAERENNVSNELIDLNHNSEIELEISDQENMVSNEDVNTMSLETNTDDSENESIDAVFDNDEQKERYIILSLHEWASSSGILSMSKIGELLAWLRLVFPNLPKSYKTLLGTPDNINIINFRNGGQFWYRGIKANLDRFILEEYLQTKGKIEIDINTDGLPLFRSSKKKFWPILVHLVGTKNESFVIALYFGKSDPSDVEEFLQDFVNETGNLINNGYVQNQRTYDFFIRHYVLDAPARELIKCCIGHNAYASCEKCTVWGERSANRQTYVDLEAPLRTDETFKNQTQSHHHKGMSPLLRLNTRMISQFRLESMHLVYEGIFKRLLEVWMRWIGPWKLHWTIVERMSNMLIQIAPSCPQDFVRKPRSLSNLAFYKATEFRRLCLYDGIVIFAQHSDINVYKHFLLLHCGIYILANPVLHKIMNDYANILLRTSIKHSVTIFGKMFVVYNVHSLCHLAQECNDYGLLESFSAFCYENKLKKNKNNLKSGFKSLQQTAKREIEQRNERIVFTDFEVNEVVLSKKHTDVNELIYGTQFKKKSVNNVILEMNDKDSCFKTNKGQIVVLKNIILREDDNVIFIDNIFINIGDFYTYPLNSSELGIIKVSELNSDKLIFPLKSVVAKCWLIPLGDEYVCISLLHTMPFCK